MASSYTEAQIATFEQTLVERNGVVSASIGDQTTTFASYEDAMKFLAHMRRNVAGGQKTRYLATKKGV